MTPMPPMTTMQRTFLATILGCGLVPAAHAQPPMPSPRGEMLKRADADGDGTVSREEFIKARTAMLEENFNRMDTNGDGKLDAQEAEAATEQMRGMTEGREGFRRPVGARPQPDGERPRRPDGERPPRPAGGPDPAEAFDRLDRDADGKLTREEFAEGMARMRENMQRGGPGAGGPRGPAPGDRGPAEGFRRPPQQD